MFRFYARSLRGVEWIVAAEIEERLNAEIVSIGHRDVHFTTASQPAPASCRLATADDIFLAVGEANAVGRNRADLDRLALASSQVDWVSALERLGGLRGAAGWTSFTVTASFLGKRNYNRYEIEERIAPAVAKSTGLRYRPTLDRGAHNGELTVRVHLVNTHAAFALRVFETPLHRREYKTRSHPGTLHPPLAAAMAMLAGLRPGTHILDPFAGAGTIAIEAKRLQPSARVVATDLDPERIADAGINAASASADIQLAVADAGVLPFMDGSFDRLVTNTPWQVAVQATGRLASAPDERRYAEFARVLNATGRAVVLAHERDASALGSLASTGFEIRFREQLSLFGQYPWLYVLTRMAPADAEPAIDHQAPFGRALLRNFHRRGNIAATAHG